MGSMQIVDQTGHTQLEWDVAAADEVQTASQQFETLIQAGHVAYGFREEGQPGEVLETFDPTVERILVRPQVVGG